MVQLTVSLIEHHAMGTNWETEVQFYIWRWATSFTPCSLYPEENHH